MVRMIWLFFKRNSLFRLFVRPDTINLPVNLIAITAVSLTCPFLCFAAHCRLC